MKGLTKKVGPLPLWMWLAIAGTVGYIVYKKSKGAGVEGVEEGYFPTQGIPSEAPEAGGSSGGLAGLGEILSDLAAAGFVPAGSEAAKAEPSEPAPAANPWREWYEEGGEPKKLPAAAGAAAKKAGKAAKGAAKGAAGKGRGANQGGRKQNPGGTGAGGARAGVGPGHPARGQHASQHATAHSAGTSHQAAPHPASRGVGVGGGRPAGGGGGGNRGRRRR